MGFPTGVAEISADYSWKFPAADPLPELFLVIGVLI